MLKSRNLLEHSDIPSLTSNSLSMSITATILMEKGKGHGFLFRTSAFFPCQGYIVVSLSSCRMLVGDYGIESYSLHLLITLSHHLSLLIYVKDTSKGSSSIAERGFRISELNVLFSSPSPRVSPSIPFLYQGSTAVPLKS